MRRVAFQKRSKCRNYNDGFSMLSGTAGGSRRKMLTINVKWNEVILSDECHALLCMKE